MTDLTDIQTVRALLSRYGFHFSKRLGQNFLVDNTVCPRIAALGNAKAGFGVLEIGPGLGTLTRELARGAEKVAAVEIDARLLPILKETLHDFQNVHILHGDILKTDIPALLREEFSTSPVAVCANLPYYITAPILMRLLETHGDIQTITVMVQKEVAEKLLADVGTREAGAITVAVHYYGTVQMLFSVPKESFYPPPQVDSAVIQIIPQKRYEAALLDEKLFFSMVRGAFSKRRKTLPNSLAPLGYEKTQLRGILRNLGLSENARIEELDMPTLVRLCNALSKLPKPESGGGE